MTQSGQSAKTARASGDLGRVGPSNSEGINCAFRHLRRIAFARRAYIDDGFCNQLCDRLVLIVVELEGDEGSLIGIRHDPNFVWAKCAVRDQFVYSHEFSP